MAMDWFLAQLLIFGGLAALATVAGGLVLYPSKVQTDYRPFLKYLLAIGAGFMLSVTLFEILPKTILLWQSTNPNTPSDLRSPMLLLLGGYLMTQFFEHTIAPHFHLGADVHEHEHEILQSRSAFAGIGGLWTHTFFDCVSIAAASQIDIKLGFLVFVAIFIHKLPEGFTIGSMILASGRGMREVIMATSAIGGATILGVLVFYILGSTVEGAVAYALPVAAGVTLYVAASDLIPEVYHHGGKGIWVSVSLFGGVGLFFLLHFLVHVLFG
ncbi:ZIP family metal transporter [soil metagenome]